MRMMMLWMMTIDVDNDDVIDDENDDDDDDNCSLDNTPDQVNGKRKYDC